VRTSRPPATATTEIRNADTSQVPTSDSDEKSEDDWETSYLSILNHSRSHIEADKSEEEGRLGYEHEQQVDWHLEEGADEEEEEEEEDSIPETPLQLRGDEEGFRSQHQVWDFNSLFGSQDLSSSIRVPATQYDDNHNNSSHINGDNDVEGRGAQIEDAGQEIEEEEEGEDNTGMESGMTASLLLSPAVSLGTPVGESSYSSLSMPRLSPAIPKPSPPYNQGDSTSQQQQQQQTSPTTTTEIGVDEEDLTGQKMSLPVGSKVVGFGTRRPPSSKSVMMVLRETYGIQPVVYPQPYYGELRDLPARPKTFGGTLFRVPHAPPPQSNHYRHLPPFSPNYQTCLLDPRLQGGHQEEGEEEEEAKLDHSRSGIEYWKKSFHVTSTGPRLQVISLERRPPSTRAVLDWLRTQQKKVEEEKSKRRQRVKNEEIEAKKKAATTVVNTHSIWQGRQKTERSREQQRRIRIKSQIEGPTPDTSNSPVLPTPKTINNNSRKVLPSEALGLHGNQHLALMSIEIHANTRGKLKPNPNFDPVCAIFYCIRDDDLLERAGTAGFKEFSGVLLFIDPSSPAPPAASSPSQGGEQTYGVARSTGVQEGLYGLTDGESNITLLWKHGNCGSLFPLFSSFWVLLNRVQSSSVREGRGVVVVVWEHDSRVGSRSLDWLRNSHEILGLPSREIQRPQDRPF
jgi:hypothetical protein